MRLTRLNNRIKRELCKETLHYVEMSFDKCLSSKSFLARKNKLLGILHKYNLEKDTSTKISHELIHELIPAGTKGMIKWKIFNNFVIEYVKREFPQHNIELHDSCWILKDQTLQKTIIGHNHLDLWSGGLQKRKAKEMLERSMNQDMVKHIYVICNGKEFKNINESFKIIESGFETESVCYITGIKRIINDFFD